MPSSKDRNGKCVSNERGFAVKPSETSKQFPSQAWPVDACNKWRANQFQVFQRTFLNHSTPLPPSIMSDSNEFTWSVKRDLQMMLSTMGNVALWKDNGEKDKEYKKLGK